GPGWGGVDEPVASAGCAGEGGAVVQRTPSAQCAGLSAAGRVLPREPEGASGGTAAKDGRGAAPTEREEPRVEAANDPLFSGGTRRIHLRPVCASSDETSHNNLGYLAYTVMRDKCQIQNMLLFSV